VARKQLKRLLSDEHMNSSGAARIKIERHPAEQFRNDNQAAIEA
jgi:hypothetical protein